jgi:hypothetical protein
VVPDKTERVFNFPPEHAAGAEGAGAGRRPAAPGQITASHIVRRTADHEVRLLANLLPWCSPARCACR